MSILILLALIYGLMAIGLAFLINHADEIDPKDETDE